MKKFMKAHYKHDRLYGRELTDKYWEGYGDLRVNTELKDINRLEGVRERLFRGIGIHESKSGEVVRFYPTDIIHWFYHGTSLATELT